MTTRIDVRPAESIKIVYSTNVHEFTMTDRNILIRSVNAMTGVPFPQPGIYLVELFCEDTCIADIRLNLKPSVLDDNGDLE